MIDEHIVKIGVDDQASDVFEKAAKSADKYEESVESVTTRLAKLTAAAAVLKVAVIDSVKAFAGAEAQQGRFDRAMSRVTGGMARQAEVNAALRANFEKFGISVREQQDYVARLADTSGDLDAAMGDLSLAMDIAAADNRDLAGTVEMLRKVRDGEVEEVKQLTGINKDLAAAIGQIKDPAERSAKAISILREEYTGAAAELAGTEDQIKKLGTAFESLQESTGRLAVTVAGRLADSFGKFFGLIGENESLLDKFALGMERASGAAKYVKTDFSSGSAIEQDVVIADMMDLLKQREMTPQGLDMMMEFLSEEYIKFGDISAQTLNAAISDADSKIGVRFRQIQNITRNRSNAISVPDVPEPGPSEQPVAARTQSRVRTGPSAGEVAADTSESIAERIAKRAEEQAQIEAAAEAERVRMEEERARELEKQEALQREYDSRERIAELLIEGRDYEVEILRIKNSSLTATEKELAILKAEAAQRSKAAAESKKQTDAYVEAVGAMGGAIGLAGELAGEEEAARRATAAVDALVYQYKAIGAWATSPAQAIAYQTAAIKAAAVAAGAIGGGGGGGGGGGAPAGADTGGVSQTSIRDNARILAEELANQQKTKPVSVNYTVNFSSLGKPGLDEVRVIRDALTEEDSRRVGGGR